MSMLQLRYTVPGDDFTRAGEASGDVKHKLKKLGYNPSAIRRVSIAMYEGEINMVIHAGGGEANVDVDPDKVVIVLTDHGPGIADVEKAMQEGWSTDVYKRQPPHSRPHRLRPHLPLPLP